MRIHSRKYGEVTGSWVYGHITPNGKIYIGSSDDKYISQRWHPDRYKECSLNPYIEKYGWDNIKHIIFKDGLTPKQAEILEGLLIIQAKIDGWCINKQNSGGEARDNIKEYKKKYDKQYREEHKEEIKEKKRLYYKEHKEKWLTPESKIYKRVNNYNRNHTPIETPKEAKNKYLEYGYIPSYIKKDDLK